MNKATLARTGQVLNRYSTRWKPSTLMTRKYRFNHHFIMLNIQGICGPESQGLFFEWLSCGRANMICIQETHATSIQEFSSWVEDYNARAAQHKQLCCKSSPGSACSCGVAILYRPAFKVLNIRRDDAGRLVVVDFSANNFDFQVMCLCIFYCALTLLQPQRKRNHQDHSPVPSEPPPAKHQMSVIQV